MIKALVFDFARVLLFPRNRGYIGTLTNLYHKMAGEPDSTFSTYYQFNQELLDFLAKIKATYPLYLFTTGTTYKAPEAQRLLKNVFIKMYSVGELGLNKDDPSAFECIASDIGVKPIEILYVDDKPSYVKTATRARFVGVVYSSNEQLFRDLKKYLNIRGNLRGFF